MGGLLADDGAHPRAADYLFAVTFELVYVHHMSTALFKDINPLASRQPKTDRLILPRFLDTASKDTRLTEDAERAHKILMHWAKLETDGTLEKLKETQLQGDFLAQVFGDALDCTRATEGNSTWTLEQHQVVGSQTPDAVLGKFGLGVEGKISAVVELKGAREHLDFGRSKSRSPVDQCWDYLVNLPTTCRWGVVSNLVSFRLYERNSTKRRYEHFSLQSLLNFDTFRQFYVLFHYNGLVEGLVKGPPRAGVLLQQTSERQRSVGDELYQAYSQKRTDLIEELHLKKGHPLPDAIEWAQRLFDRVIFIAFCEDRELLPSKTLETAWDVKGFHAVTNPRWQSFKNLFRMVDEGGPPNSNIPAYNGGLFAKGPVDNLELDDERYTGFFKNLGTYDFADEVNLDVLGHLFERSITEVEKLKESGFFGGDAAKAQAFAKMPQSAKRKRLGIYYTPPELTSRIVQYTVEELIDERFKALPGDPESPETAHARLGVLRNLKIVDPACGSGAFLFQAYDALELRYAEVLARLPEADRKKLAPQVPGFILNDNLYGVDLSPEAVEITQLALWIRSADRNHKLARLSHNIVHGNSLVADLSVDPHAFNWKKSFPEVFDREESGFDCVIGNPPWERMDLAEREFFSLPAPEIATATTGAKRRALIKALESTDPALYARFLSAKANTDAQRIYCRESGEYPLTARGRTNTYAVFAELAQRLLATGGRAGVLVPSGIAMHDTTKAFFDKLATKRRLLRLYEFDNRKRTFFPDVHPDTQFVILNFAGSPSNSSAADFIFGVESIEELEIKRRHINLTGDDIRLLNPNTRTCPIFRTNRDAEITKGIYRRVSVLLEKSRRGPTGNPWGTSFKQGFFNQTSDSEHFREARWLEDNGLKHEGNRWLKQRQIYLPLFEAKMVEAFNHRFATAYTEEKNWNNQGQTTEASPVELANPEFLAQPRYWARIEDARKRCPAELAHLTFRDVTNPSNRRTMIAQFIPDVACLNTLPIILVDGSLALARRTCLLANFNALAFDFTAKQKVHGRHMNFFMLEQLPVFPPPDRYDEPCPWAKGKTLEAWIAERVLKLTCTAEDMLPLADACGFTGGSFKSEYGGRLNKWNDRERAELMAELDAAFFHLYGLDHDDAEYVLSTFKGIHEGNPLLPGHPSTAKFILELYDGFALQSG
jgi:hypothetical protein